MIVLHLFNAGPFDIDTIVYMNFSMKLRRNPFIFLKRKLYSLVPRTLTLSYFQIIEKNFVHLAYFKIKTSRADPNNDPKKPQTFAEIETVIGFAVIAVVAI